MMIKNLRGLMTIRGIIALDIDGTIVDYPKPLSRSFVAYVEKLFQDGWQLLFATGRTEEWALSLLSSLSCPFFLAAYNGARLVSVPHHEEIYSHEMKGASLGEYRQLFLSFGAVCYTKNQGVFFCPAVTYSYIDQHLQARRQQQKEEWQIVQSIEAVAEMRLLSVRVFASPLEALMVSRTLSASFHAPVMRDAFDENIHIVQLTDGVTSKGQALLALKERFSPKIVIAAGNDGNDLELLQYADIRVAVGNAPAEIQQIATDTIDSSVEITEGLERAVLSAEGC